MGDHDMPSSWLERWKEAEPVRLYGWSVATAVLVGGVATGLWTETWALAVGGVASAVLMVGGTALARRQAYAPLTVRELLERRLDEQHVESYERGVRAGIAAAAAAAAPTQELHVVAPETLPRQALARCRYVESGRRCLLPAGHPENVKHQLEVRRPAE